ncbi:hypothetical protein GCM10025331_55920 [Actinoplanes utahensis]|nr:hypothetical protein Aut01nite_63500 [Actinoplanes utahensis]
MSRQVAQGTRGTETSRLVPALTRRVRRGATWNRWRNTDRAVPPGGLLIPHHTRANRIASEQNSRYPVCHIRHLRDVRAPSIFARHPLRIGDAGWRKGFTALPETNSWFPEPTGADRSRPGPVRSQPGTTGRVATSP